MTHRTTLRTASLGLALIIAGCTPPALHKLDNEALLPQIDIVQIKENADEALKIAQETKLTVEAMNTRLLEIDNRLVMISDEVSSVSIAKIEELENRLALLIEAYKDLQSQISAIEVMPRARAKSGQPATFSPAVSATLPVTTEYALYESALKSFDKRLYAEAEKLFADLLQKYPKGDYAPSAQYWIGECSFSRSDFAKAIASFQKTLAYPLNPKSDDAQFKIGQSYVKLGKYDHAAEAFKYLVDRYPASDLVPRARKFLEEITAIINKKSP